MKTLLKALALPLALCFASPASAVVIEGTTPSGKFKTVGLDENGNFRVATATSSIQIVITATGSVTSIPGGVSINNTALVPAIVQGSVTGVPLPVTGNFTVSVATAGVVTASQVPVAPTALEFTILATASTRKQSIVCNNDSSLTVWLGPVGVTTATGIPLAAGACMAPDVPASFVGQMNGISSTTFNASAVSVMSFF